MKHSESIAMLSLALVKAAAELKPVVKDRVNPHFKNKYATLDAITESARPVLAKHGLAIVQGTAFPDTGEGHLTGFAVETMLVHSSGEWLSNAVFVPVEKPSAQGAGSAISYGRRYGLSALLGLTSDEDDDGETATNHAPVARPASAPRPAPASAPAAPKAAPAKAGAVPSCPKCGGAMWDNRKENAERVANGQKARPAFACKDKNGCGEVVWKESVEPQVVGVGAFDGDNTGPGDDMTDDLPFSRGA